MINPEPSVGSNMQKNDSSEEAVKALMNAFESIERATIENAVRFDILKSVIFVAPESELPKKKELYALVCDLHDTHQRWAKKMREIRKLP